MITVYSRKFIEEKMSAAVAVISLFRHFTQNHKSILWWCKKERQGISKVIRGRPVRKIKSKCQISLYLLSFQVNNNNKTNCKFVSQLTTEANFEGLKKK